MCNSMMYIGIKYDEYMSLISVDVLHHDGSFFLSAVLAFLSETTLAAFSHPLLGPPSLFEDTQCCSVLAKLAPGALSQLAETRLCLVLAAAGALAFGNFDQVTS